MRSFVGRFRYFCVFAVLLTLVVRPVGGQEGPQNEPAHCFLWKVSSKTTTVYLLGSMHVAKADLFPLPKEIEDAFAKSKTLVVELNTEGLDQTKMQKLLLQKGLYPAGDKLSKHLSKKTLDLLEQYCAKKEMK